MLIKSKRASKSKNIKHPNFPIMMSNIMQSFEEMQGTDINSVHNRSEYIKRLEALQNKIQMTQESSYQDGFQDGEKVGYEQGLNTIQNSVQQLGNLINAIRNQQEDVVASTEKFIIKFALKIVEKIIGSDEFSNIKINKNKLQKSVAEALNLFSDSTKFIVRVHKETAKILEDSKSEILEQLSRPVALSIIDDVSLKPGECLIE
ncbi:MAG: FliH/SctL family protein, partial [bacterium]